MTTLSSIEDSPRKILTIATNAFRETLRQPVFCVMLGIAGGMIALSPTFAMFTLLENVRLVKDIGLSTILLAGLLLAVLSASSTVAEEIRGKTALMVVSRPVSRAQFVVGKYLGIAAAQLVVTYLLTLTLVMTVRFGVPEAAYSKLDYSILWGGVVALLATLLVAAGANYFFDRPFPSAVIAAALPFFTVCFVGFAFVDRDLKIVPFFSSMDLETVRACVTLGLCVLVMTAMAVACATRLTLVTSLVVCSLFFIIGMLSDWMFGGFGDKSLFQAAPYALIPNLQVFWMSDALSADQPIPWGYVGTAAGYAVLHTTALLFLGLFFFETREIA